MMRRLIVALALLAACKPHPPVVGGGDTTAVVVPAPPVAPPPVVTHVPPVVTRDTVEDVPVVGLIVSPQTATMDVGARQQLCAFVRFADSVVALRARERTVPACFLAYKRTYGFTVVTARQQAAADKVCVDWTVSGGSITPEKCD